ncbi:RICIN domain-containing protein [Streptomyces sp. 303MFCol5.2]|uniref:RICIN domain-containing protein n=1 Tax=Streptomyces sp. 303MFCol5.2 TaxID=1172181 RepID=UPI00035CD2F9|nr:RICIN domain-containing protein [Streptomyces sp. 303MFCol5.2]
MTADPGERAADVADAAQDEHASAHLGTATGPGAATEPGASAGAGDSTEAQAAESGSPLPRRSMFAGRAGVPRRSAMTEARMAAVRVVEPDPVGQSDPGADAVRGPGTGLGLSTRPEPEPEPASGDLLVAHTAATASDTAARTGRRRLGKGVLAGTAVAGLILVAVPFLVSAVGDGKRGSASGDTVDSDLGDHATGDAPDAFGSASPSSDAKSHLTSVGSAGSPSVPSAPSAPSSSSASPDTTEPATAGTSSSGHASTGTGGSTTVSGVPIRSHASGKCIDVSGGESVDGVPLDILDCASATRMSWTFASDGTVRALGRCMDVAGGSTGNGAKVQLADCNGGPAQQFRLNDAHDLVNRQADKCVDVTDAKTADGTGLQIWDCTGADNQKWSKG